MTVPALRHATLSFQREPEDVRLFSQLRHIKIVTNLRKQVNLLGQFFCNCTPGLCDERFPLDTAPSLDYDENAHSVDEDPSLCGGFAMWVGCSYWWC